MIIIKLFDLELVITDSIISLLKVISFRHIKIMYCGHIKFMSKKLFLEQFQVRLILKGVINLR